MVHSRPALVRLPCDEPSDECLATQVQTGDRQAYAQLVARYLPRTVAVAQRVVLRRSEAEDVAQDVFLKLWRDPFQFQPQKGRFAAWLYRVTCNRALDVARRTRPEPLADGFDSPDPAASVVETLVRRERAQALTVALQALPERQRAALALSYQAELADIEAAAAMGVSVKAYESLLVRARRALRETMIAEGGHDAG